jgi:chemotaxis protein methyltransferase CheR
VKRLADEGKFLDAARECDRLLEHEHLNPVAHFYQGLIAEQLGRHADAERAFKRAVYLDRAFVLAHYQLALLCARAGRRESAVHSLGNVQRLLTNVDGARQIAGADGLTVHDLVQLAALHLELWQK